MIAILSILDQWLQKQKSHIAMNRTTRSLRECEPTLCLGLEAMAVQKAATSATTTVLLYRVDAV